MGVFTMPSLGADMEAGTLTEWLVGPGDTVKRGDIVAVVETQKGAIEIEIFESGTVERLEAEIGQKLPVGAPLALIRGEGEAASEMTPAPAAPKPASAKVPESAAPRL
ncbi:MAG: biotin/lipoyl-containing protein, partial [Rhodovulum sp.]